MFGVFDLKCLHPRLRRVIDSITVDDGRQLMVQRK